MKLKIYIVLILSFTCIQASFSQMVPTYDDVMIPMSDLKELEADVYVPSGCTSCEVILVQTPYNKELFEWGLPLGIGTNLNDQQFIWVVVDWRGFYGSAAAAVSSPDRGQDAYDICDWITNQSWHADRIGTWGPSALGNIQYQLIGKHHPNHTCAIPIVANPQFSYESYFYGGVLEEARLEQLDALGYGLSPVVMSNVYYSSIWQIAENSTYYPDLIEIPTLQIGGWYDHNIDEMMEFYKNSRNEAAVSVQEQQWLLVGPWVHGGTGIAYVGSANQGELVYTNAAFVNDDMSWDFLEYYLLDSANDWMSTPKITYYELGTNTWNSSNLSDISISETSVLYLNSINRLTGELGNGSSSMLSDPNDPTPTIGGATLHDDLDQGPYDQTYLDGRDDILTFSSDVLTNSVSISGRITVKLFVSSTSSDCDVVVRLVDQYPDGTNMLITDGIQRLRFREGYTVADETLMIPGEIYEVDVTLPFTNYTWLAGHKIKIYLSGNSSIRWHLNLQDGLAMYTSAAAQTATITVHHNADFKSRMILPGNNQHLAIHEKGEHTNVILYPNPAKNWIYIESPTQLNSYQIMDLSGKLIERNLIQENYISVESLENGIYLIYLTADDGSVTEKKFVKN